MTPGTTLLGTRSLRLLLFLLLPALMRAASNCCQVEANSTRPTHTSPAPAHFCESFSVLFQKATRDEGTGRTVFSHRPRGHINTLFSRFVTGVAFLVCACSTPFSEPWLTWTRCENTYGESISLKRILQFPRRWSVFVGFRLRISGYAMHLSNYNAVSSLKFVFFLVGCVGLGR